MFGNFLTKLFSSKGKHIYPTLVSILMSQTVPPPAPSIEQRKKHIAKQIQCFINSGPRYWKLAESIIDRYCVKEKLLDEKVWRGKLDAARAKQVKPKAARKVVRYSPSVKPDK